MQAILCAAILLLSFSSATPQPAPAPAASPAGRQSLASSAEIKATRADLETSSETSLENNTTPATPDVGQKASPAPASAPTQAAPAPVPTTAPLPPAGFQGRTAPSAASPSGTAPTTGSGEAAAAPTLPLDRVCNALLTSAQNNGLPPPFFANLIWQESRLRDDAVSPKGALGIAQFMPKVAAESGLANPLDPLQALSVSARMLRELFDQFGNLGFVAAAYNAGAKRVHEWLQRGRALPRETRGYVVDVTGRTVEQWQKAPPSADALTFARRLPCRDLPAFAELEQAQSEEAQTERQKTPQAQVAPPAQAERRPHAKLAEKSPPARRARAKRTHLAERKPAHPAIRRQTVRTATRERERVKREAWMRIRRMSRERHSRV